MGTWLARLTSRTMLSHVRYVRPVPPGTATGPVGRVYRQVAEDFGMYAPPLLLHSPAPDTLTACWVLLRETLLAAGRVPRATKEMVAEAVSADNRCPYCVEVHGASAKALAGSGGDSAADPLAEWARLSGRPDAGPAPFPPEHRAEIVGVAVTFHYINRLVSVFLRESPLPNGPRGVRRAASWLIGSVAGPGVPPGRSLRLLPPAALPADLSWAAGQPHIAAAAGSAAATIDEAGAAVLSGTARALVRAVVDDPPEIGVGRLPAFELGDLDPGERPLARLAVLSAVAPHRVDEHDVAACRAAGADDRALVTAASWAAMTVARRIGAAHSADG